MEHLHTSEEIHQLAQIFSETVLGFETSAYARMQGPRAEKKYLKIHRPLTTPLIQAHLAGDITVAVSLIGPDGQARAIALDIDTGGVEALQSVLEFAQVAGLTAFAQTSTTGEHDGGHVWILFEKPTAPERLRKLGEQLAQGAQVEAEVYPTRKAIRLPLGVHTWTGKRGTLIFQNGEVVDLDQTATEIPAAVAKIAALRRNSLSLLPPVVEPSKHSREMRSEPFSQATGSNPIQDYNRRTDLLEAILRAGGSIAEEYADGRFLVHCPCGHHNHGDAKPSLELQPASNPGRYGRYIAVGYAPGCLFHTERGQVVDAFNAYCKLEHLTPRDAVKQLTSGRQTPRETRAHQSHKQGEEKGSSEGEEASGEPGRLNTDKIRAIRQAAEGKAQADEQMTKGTRRTFQALLQHSGEGLWYWYGNSRLAQTTDLSERQVQRALHWLTSHSYLEARPRLGETTLYQITSSCEGRHLSSTLVLETSTTSEPVQVTCQPPHDSEAASQEASGATEADGCIVNYPDGASYTPPRRQKKDPISARLDKRRRRVDRWRAMDVQRLERERLILTATAEKSRNPKQKAALGHQVKELEHELSRKRGEGIQAMIAASGSRRRASQEVEPPAPRPPTDEEPRGASQVDSPRPVLAAQELCRVIGTDPVYSDWAHRRFGEMLAHIQEKRRCENATGTGFYSPV